MLACVQAKIVDDGLWTGNDWFDSASKIGVENGVPYSNDDDVLRRINAPITIDGEVTNWSSKENVERVREWLTDDVWEELFPMHDAIYTFESFL